MFGSAEKPVKNPLRRSLGALMTVALVMATGVTASTTAAIAQEAVNVPPTMLILDASGSMLADDAGGQLRIDAAKDATADFFASVDDDSRVGLMTYGTGTGNTPEEQEAGCRDVSVLRGLGTGQQDELTDVARDIEASGYTPMGPALQQAAEELPDSGERTIVLVSDGLDTCAPPPVCEIAGELRDQGVDLVINTVGFRVDEEARAELQCIAQAGGGSYRNADDATSLADSMKILATRGINAYDSDLEEIKGVAAAEGTAVEDINEVPRETTRFASAIEDQAQPLTSTTARQYWRIPMEPGERIAVGMSTTQPPSAGGWVGDERLLMQLAIENPSCSQERWSDTQVNFPNGPQNSAVVSQVVGENRCEGDELVISASRSGDFMQGQDIPVELTITRFMGEDLTGVPDPEPESEPEAAAPPVDTQRVTPGTWFDDAPELPADGKVAAEADIVPGETHFYRVEAGYGQRVTGVLEPLGTDAELSSIQASTHRLEVRQFNEARQTAQSTESVRVLSDEPLAFGQAAPINYRNVIDGDVAVRNAWLDGTQYLAVEYDAFGGGRSEIGDAQQAAARYRINAQVMGEEVPGPTFSDASAGDSRDAATEEEPAADTEDTAAAPQDGRTNWLFVGIGAAVLVILILVGLMVLVRRNQATHV